MERICSFVVFCLISTNSCLGEFVTIQTVSGPIMGFSANGMTTFHAIPYGEAPVDRLRFQRPQKKEPWLGVFNATNEGDVCIQFNPPPFAPPRSESEDCLSLDVYVPRDLSTVGNSLESLPVLVHIHPGGFVYGSRLDNNSTMLAMEGNMIVVNINYRLGPLGFLALELDETPGNVGLLDQKLALEWVANNIESFGGNPEKVTAYGASAGSISVSMQLLSPAFKGLFRSAILSSGVYHKNLQTRKEAAEETLKISDRNSCDNTNSETILRCLQDLDVLTLKNSISGIQFIPVADGDLIRDQPPMLLKSGRFNHVPVMLGFNSDDGLLSFMTNRDLMISGIEQNDIDEAIIEKFRLSRIGLSHDKVVTAVELAKTFYFSNPADPFSNLRSALDAYRDLHYVAPILKLANGFSKEGVPVYLYEYDEKPQSNPFGQFVISTGANHGDEMPFIFGKVFDQAAFPLDSTPTKLKFAENLMKTWSDFVHNGEPILRTGLLEQEWPPYKPDKQAYAFLKADGSFIENNPAPLAEKVFNKMLDDVRSPITCQDKRSPELDTNPIVVTESGRVKGTRMTNGTGAITVDTYYAIPYAAPPVTNLRFRRTQPVKPWKGILEAMKFGPACSQSNPWVTGKTSEDCLTLNIWVPKGVDQARKAPKPILFYIHGGGFVAGSSRDLNMIGLAVHGDVMVVSVQYRLGVLGFLSSGNSSMPGNVAAWDLLEALKWVRANARYFGGDVDKITVGGHSAGGALATMIMLSPKFQGLFSNVFAMSGFILSSFAVETKPEIRYSRLMEKSGCDEKNTDEEKIECLRKLPLSEIFEIGESEVLNVLMKPNVDGVILTDYPHNLLQEVHLSKVKFLGGSVLTEGFWIGGQPPPGMTHAQYASLNMNTLYPHSSAVAQAVLEFYNINGTGDALKYGNSVRDLFFHAGSESIANSVISQGGDAYVYIADFNPPQRTTGAIHGDELLLFSGWPLMEYLNTNFTEEQTSLSRTWVSYFANFIATGNPNNNIPVPASWPTYDVQTRTHLVLSNNMDSNSVQYSHRVKYVDFVNNLMPKLINKVKCIEDDDIARIGDIMSEAEDDKIDETAPLCGEANSGLFNASRKQMDVAVIGLIVACVFLLLLVMVLAFILHRRTAKSSPKSYAFSNDRHLSNGVSY